MPGLDAALRSAGARVAEIGCGAGWAAIAKGYPTCEVDGYDITLLVPDFKTGDAVAIIARAEYTNERVLSAERRDPLEQHRNAHPVQGYMRCDIDSVLRLRAVMHPRERQLASVAINSASSTDEQAPR